METWFLILVSISISLLLKAFFDLFLSPTKPTGKSLPTLPPGPPIFPVIGNIVWLRRSFSEMEPVLRALHSKLGPIISLRLGSRPSIFVADRSLAHQALVQNGAVFADRPRPKSVSINRIASSNQKNISSAPYGATWRLLRRNLTAEILHPSRVKSYSHARKWVLQILIDRLAGAGDGAPVRVVDHFHYATFCLLVLMCFGDKLEEEQIKDVERVERNMILNIFKYNILNFFPKVTKVLFRKKWEEFLQLRKDQEDVLIPLIRARKDALRDKKEGETLAYVDTLFGLVLPDENRNLNDDELVTLCNEFLNAGTDTTSTALQWIMARLVKHPDVQDRVYSEIEKSVGPAGADEIGEERLGEMTYLKAVVLEGLRRHPPGHFVLPHAVTDDVELGGHLVPRRGTVNFMVADMGWDPEVWEDPMEFRPDRFVGKEKDYLDITGSKGIKMMPFGVGRRMCPAYGLAMLHLEYFVANLVWRFEWKEVEGVGVDLSEKQEFTMVMKFPLQARLVPRFNGVR